MSVDRLALLANANDALAEWPNCGLARLVTGEIRQLGLQVEADPLPNKPAHALVLGKKTKSIARRLARMASWAQQPDEK
jgi:hypothetical protein